MKLLRKDAFSESFMKLICHIVVSQPGIRVIRQTCYTQQLIVNSQIVPASQAMTSPESPYDFLRLRFEAVLYHRQQNISPTDSALTWQWCSKARSANWASLKKLGHDGKPCTCWREAAQIEAEERLIRYARRILLLRASWSKSRGWTRRKIWPYGVVSTGVAPRQKPMYLGRYIQRNVEQRR